MDQTDAAVLDGRLRVGAVGALPWMRHPVSVARRLLEQEKVVLLVAAGATAFAKEQGFTAEEPAALV